MLAAKIPQIKQGHVPFFGHFFQQMGVDGAGATLAVINNPRLVITNRCRSPQGFIEIQE